MKPILAARFLASCLAALTLSAAPLSAQGPVPPPGAAPLVGMGAAPGGDSIELKWRDESLAQVLGFLEMLTGRSVLRPQALPTPTFTFDSRGPMSRAEAVLAVESLLSLNGIAVAPMGDRFIKVVPIGNIRTEAPELVVGSLRDQPPSGRVVSKLFRLEHLDTTAFQTQIQPFLSPGFGTVVPFQNTSTLLVTDTVTNLQRLEYVVAEVDRPRNLATKFYTLRYAQASAVAEKIKALIDATRTAFSAQGARPAGPQAAAPLNLPTAPGGGAEGVSLSQALLASNTSLNFDERTNQIILVTEPPSVPFFDNLIEKLDVQADPSTTIAVIPIQHAMATEVASVLSQFISGATQATQRATGTDARTRRTPNTRDTFAGLRQQQAQPAVQPAVGLAAGAAPAIGERESQFSSFMTIVADERSNAIVASGTQDDLNLVRELIRQIDIVLPQVRIEVLIAEVQLNDGVQRGIDAFNLKIEGDRVVGFGGSGSGFAVTNGRIDRALTPFEVSMDLVVSAVNSRRNVNILSAPTVVTTHNKEATIIVAQARPIVTSTQSDLSNSTGLRTSFSFQDIGLELKVKPLIGSEGTIQMEIDQSADDIVDKVTIDGNEQPIIGRRQATSFLSATDGDIIVLGGLQSRQETNAKALFPFLGELPLVGGLFGKTTRDRSRTELLLFIRPKLLPTTAAAAVDANARLRSSDLPNPVQERISGGASAQDR